MGVHRVTSKNPERLFLSPIPLGGGVYSTDHTRIYRCYLCLRVPAGLGNSPSLASLAHEQCLKVSKSSCSPAADRVMNHTAHIRSILHWSGFSPHDKRWAAEDRVLPTICFSTSGTRAAGWQGATLNPKP